MALSFISDLHLSEDNSKTTEGFINFLKEHKSDLDQLYILGDLFEVWIGDDYTSTFIENIKNHLKKLSDSGVDVFFMHGNRDFLIGDQFLNETGISLLTDPYIFDFFDQRIALSHGDMFCTQDTDYMLFKKQVRDSNWQIDFLSKSITARQDIAISMRNESKANNINKDISIMDVENSTVEKFLTKNQIDLLIHGHTHRPATHIHQCHQRESTRIVLGDWQDTGWCLLLDEQTQELSEFKV